MTVRAIQKGLYEVQSESQDLAYVVTPGKSCTCKAFQFRGGPCKHMISVDEHLAQQTKLGKASDTAVGLTEEELIRYAREKNGTPAGAACYLELARRQNTLKGLFS